MQFDNSELSVLAYWIKEREAIRVQKDAGKPKPWTKDPILRAHKFCNVVRAYDRVSRWLRAHWYSRTASVQTLLAGATCARLFNWPDTLEEYAGKRKFKGWTPQWMEVTCMQRIARGDKVFTGAYLINGAAGGPKYAQVCRIITEVAHSPNTVVRDSTRETHANLMRFKGIGSFIAGQIVADLVWTKALNKAKDIYTWAPIGPGSRRGMRRLLGLSARGGMAQAEFEGNLLDLFRLLHTKYRIPVVKRMNIMDLQNCLCEFDKMRRMQNGEGRMRSHYPGV